MNYYGIVGLGSMIQFVNSMQSFLTELPQHWIRSKDEVSSVHILLPHKGQFLQLQMGRLLHVDEWEKLYIGNLW